MKPQASVSADEKKSMSESDKNRELVDAYIDLWAENNALRECNDMLRKIIDIHKPSDLLSQFKIQYN